MTPPEKTRNTLRQQYPPVRAGEDDLLLCRSTVGEPGSDPVNEEYTCLYVQQRNDGTPCFYLSFRPVREGPLEFRRLKTPSDAAAFVLGAAGPALAGYTGEQKALIRTLFPGWFDDAENDFREPGPAPALDPAEPGSGSSSGRLRPVRILEPPYPSILWHSLPRPGNGSDPSSRGIDLLASRGPGGIPRFWFRYWTWEGTWTNRCDPATWEDAAAFVRERMEDPARSSCANFTKLREFFPETCNGDPGR